MGRPEGTQGGAGRPAGFAVAGRTGRAVAGRVGSGVSARRRALGESAPPRPSGGRGELACGSGVSARARPGFGVCARGGRSGRSGLRPVFAVCGRGVCCDCSTSRIARRAKLPCDTGRSSVAAAEAGLGVAVRDMKDGSGTKRDSRCTDAEVQEKDGGG